MKTIIPRSLVVKKLEGVSKLIFKNYYKQITSLIGNSHGIYALYDESELYYVGKSTDLKNRVKQHLKDKHLASWTHFSLYLIRNADHIGEIESLLIRIANPKGNTKKYKAEKGGSLLKQLKREIRLKQKEELDLMFNRTTKKLSTHTVSSNSKNQGLVGLVSHKTALYRAFKGREYRALLTPKGKIKLNGKVFYTPTSAAISIVKRNVNGWDFWYVKDSNGEWVKLSELRHGNSD